MASLDVRCLSVEPSAHPAAYLRAVRALLGGFRPGSALLAESEPGFFDVFSSGLDVVVMREVVDELSVISVPGGLPGSLLLKGPLGALVFGGSSRRFVSGSLLVFVVFFCFDAPFCVERKLARSRFFFQDLTMSYSSSCKPRVDGAM